MTDDEADPNLQTTAAEDDGPSEPTLRPYMMSREFRGWIGGIAAALVAVAAVGPFLDLGPFGTSASVGGLIPGFALGDEAYCSDEDQSGGMGGQHLSCTFVCPNGPGSISVYVDADDSDATVSGTAACGGDSVHCSGRNSCGQTETRTAGGPATCNADSDEFVDSGLFVECSAAVDEGSVPGPEVGSEYCPVTDPVKVCVQPVCGHFANTLQAACQEFWERLTDRGMSPFGASAGFWTDGSEGVGLVCSGYVCTPAVPICAPKREGVTCSLA